MNTLGIIGGLGPMATAHLLQLIIEMTDAKTDQEHLDIIVFNRPSVPDRTAYILDNSKPSPLPVMKKTAQTLQKLGASCICAPCVTSHYFYDELSKSVRIPFINMVEKTADELYAAGKEMVGIMATTGTVRTGLFQKALYTRGLYPVVPDADTQNMVMSIIYDDIKAGKKPDMAKFDAVSEKLRGYGCDSIILGCTELSLIKRDIPLSKGYIDALEVLAKSCVLSCNAPLKSKYESLFT